METVKNSLNWIKDTTNKQVKQGDAAPYCVQCGEEMYYGTDWDKFVPVCDNAGCPCYGLLQIGIEKMQEIRKKYARRDESKT